ncbi:hypothetical protein DEA8626_02115 [Defluviimonas aquaemixtae]|uniref:Uncharacterized protein n=1 Tax=Albidovulum aquaemixtae TaxID=1542388 RepID=A0A2R8B7H9_9RHOB|nr:YeeE/YedE family protein [Defluviimonas aquaemixtae]SPH18575.1 hypothetical protein DEA8626_02115 [Defluviimonas aquaemixtae]
MFESLGFETLTPQGAAVLLGLALGAAFGALAETTRFCLRRGLVGDGTERRAALGVWLMALAVAVAGTQGAVAAGWIGFGEHRFLAADLPVVAILAGGLLFGAGMVLTRGCASRLTVLAASGNLRAATVIIVFAIAAHAALKGILAPLRTALGSFTVPLGDLASLAALPGGALFWTFAIAAAAALYALRSGNRPALLIGAALIGALIPLGWAGTGFVLYDEFDPIAFESLSFTSPSSETLFWTIASTSIPAGFGTGLIGGTLAGAAALALLSGRFQWQSFDTPRSTLRYLAGAALMGVGGVLAGGCTVGAGLSGVPTLSVAAILALLAIVAGARFANRFVSASISGSAAPSATRPA